MGVDMNNRLEGGSGPIRGRDFGITNVPDLKVTTTGGRRGGIPLPGKPEVGRPDKEHKGSPVRKVLGRVLLAASAVGLGGGAYAVYQEVPAVHQAVDQQFLQRIGVKDPEAPTTFDNTAEKGVIGPSNTVVLSQEEINQLFPTAFGKLKENGNNTLREIPFSMSAEEKAARENAGGNIGIKLEIREDKGTLQLQNPLDLSKSSDPNANIPYTKEFSGGLPTGNALDLEKSLQEQGFYNQLKFQGVPQGTVIEAPVDGFLRVSTSDGNKSVPGKITTGFIDFQGPDGTIYNLWIFGSKGNSIFVLNPLLDAPERADIGSYGTRVNKGQPLFETATRLDELVLYVAGASKGKVGEAWDYNSPSVATNLEFLVDLDSGKVITSTPTSNIKG